MIGSNCKKIILDIEEQKLTAVLPSGSLDVNPTFYMSDINFTEMEKDRFEGNPYAIQRLPVDSSDNNSTIGIELLYKEKVATDENLKDNVLAIAWLIHHLRSVQGRLPMDPPMMQPNYSNKKYVQNLQEYYDNYLKQGMEFDGSKIKGAIPLTRSIEDLNDLNVLNSKIDQLPDKIDDDNMSSLIEDLLAVLDEVKSESEATELSRRRNSRRYAYFYEAYKKILEAVTSKPKTFGETNASKAKEIMLENFQKKAEEKMTQRQWRSYRTSAERIYRLWNICNKNFAIFDLVTGLTPSLFDRLPSKDSAERWFLIIEKGIYYTQQEYRDTQKQQEEKVADDDGGNSSNNSGSGGRGRGRGRGRGKRKGRGRGNKAGSKGKEKAV